MKRIIHKSVIPIYVAAILWLLWCILLPMYRLWHYLACGLVAAAGYFLATRLFPGTVEETELPPDSGDPGVDQLILTARGRLQEISRLREQVASRDMQKSLGDICRVGQAILTALEKDVTRSTQVRRFLDYYLPTTLSLAGRYYNLESQQIRGSNITEAMEKIQALMGQLAEAFSNQMNDLYGGEVMDITAEIRVMEQMLMAQGLIRDENELS